MIVNRDRIVLEIKRARLPFVLLALLAVGAGVAGWAIFRNLSFERPWQGYTRVQAAFEDVKGVAPGKQPVRISGVQVGVIQGWKVEKGRAVLTLSIERRFGRIYRDATMQLRPVTPLQDMYVEVDRGTPQAGVLEADEILPASRTRAPVDIARVLNTFEAPTRQRLGVLLTQLGRGTDDQGGALREAFGRLGPFLSTARELADALGRRRVSTRRLVTNLAGLTGTLARRDEQVEALARNANATLGTLAEHDAGLDATLRELAPTLVAIEGSFRSLRSAQDELDPAIRSLRPVTRELRSGLEALRVFSVDATPALDALMPAVRALRPFARKLVPTSQNLGRAVQELLPQAPKLDRVTQRLVPCLPALSDFVQWTPSVIKFADANGVNPRADMSFGLDSADGRLPDPQQIRTEGCTDTEGFPKP